MLCLAANSHVFKNCFCLHFATGNVSRKTGCYLQVQYLQNCSEFEELPDLDHSNGILRTFAIDFDGRACEDIQIVQSINQSA